MNKKLIAIAVAGVMSAPLAANAANVSGFTAVDWTLANDNPVCTNGSGNEVCETQFHVDQTEVDFEANGVRVDINDDGAGIEVEQAKFTTALGSTGWDLHAGLMNSGLSADHQDRNMMAFDTNSLVFENYSAADLVNVAGIAVTGMAGPANVMLAVVNDPTVDPATTDATNAIVLAVSGTVTDGLNAGLSVVSADADDLTDVTIDYTMDAFTVGLDYFTSDATDTYSVTAGYDLGNGMDIKLRIDNDETAGTSSVTTDTTTVAFGYHLSDATSLRLENYARDNGTTDYTVTSLSFVSNF